MFSLFKPSSYLDPQLGELRWKGGLWRGSLSFGGSVAPLALAGTRASPDAQALQVARVVSVDYPQWQPEIGRAMFDHYAPHATAVTFGEELPPPGGMPDLGEPEEVWPHAAIRFVQIAPLDGTLMVEIGYQVAWDDEHTVGARLHRGRLVELNGSVLPR